MVAARRAPPATPGETGLFARRLHRRPGAAPILGALGPCGSPHCSLHVSKDRDKADARGCPLQTPDSRPRRPPSTAVHPPKPKRLSLRESPPTRPHGGGAAFVGSVSLT